MTEKKTKKTGSKVIRKRIKPVERVKNPWADLCGLYRDKIHVAEGDVFNLEL